MALGDFYDSTTTVGDLRNQLTAKGFIGYTAPGGPYPMAYMHPLKLRPVLLVGQNFNLCLVYQKRMVDNAIRRS